MRNIVVLEHLSLDGVLQGPGRPDEDTSGGFTLGGWIDGFSDAVLTQELRGMMNSPFDLLLGRRTYDLWASYWPQNSAIWPRVNEATKFVASNTLTSGPWSPTTILNHDVVDRVKALRRGEGPDLHVWGSGELVQTLLQHALVDVLWLMIYPVTLGKGKRLFAGAVPARFTLKDLKVTTKGVLVARYEKGETEGRHP